MKVYTVERVGKRGIAELVSLHTDPVKATEKAKELDESSLHFAYITNLMEVEA